MKNFFLDILKMATGKKAQNVLPYSREMLLEQFIRHSGKKLDEEAIGKAWKIINAHFDKLEEQLKTQKDPVKMHDAMALALNEMDDRLKELAEEQP